MSSRGMQTLMGGETQAVDLGDARRNQRHQRIVETIARHPEKSLPNLFKDDSELQAVYRFFSNERIAFEACIEPHLKATRERCLQRDQRVLVAHDTTEFSFPGEVEREGLGDINSSGRGFFLHASLAMTGPSARRPLGVINAETYVRAPDRARRPNGKRNSGKARYDDPTKETARWGRGIDSVEQALGAGNAIHLADREGDSYDILCQLARSTAGQPSPRFVLRVRADRLVSLGEESGHLRSLLAQTPLLFEREVPLSKRTRKKGALSPKVKKKNPPRSARIAKLEVRAARVVLRRPSGWPKSLPRSIELNCVLASEVQAPEGEPPVEWLLYTSEPVSTSEQVAFVIDCYCRRWLIEEYFKALKTGCGFEERQLTSYHALRNFLAVVVPIAWRLLLLRDVARHSPAAPAHQVLSPSQIALLQTAKPFGITLPPSPKARDALRAVAALGGHLKRNGEPGWIILGRGFQELLTMEVGWLAANAMSRHDPSNP